MLAETPRRRYYVVAPDENESAQLSASSMTNRRTLSGVVLAAMPLLLYVYMPRPPFAGSHVLTYPVLATTLGALAALLAVRYSAADRRVLIVTVLCLLLSSAAGVSALLNSSHLRATAPLDIVRPAVLLIFFIYGYYLSCYATEDETNRGLVLASYVILAGQLLIGTLQIVGVSFFDIIYSEEKTRTIGDLLRITGSLSNPNTFGWIIAQTSLTILLLSSRSRRYLVLFVAAPLILVSGSRSTLIVYPLMIAVALVLKTLGRMRAFGSAFGYALVVGVALLAVLTTFGEYFPYHSQLRSVIETGSLMSVHSFAKRVDHWRHVYTLFEAAGHTAWLIGLGSRDITRVLDNDFLYVFFRLGVFGFVTHMAVILYIGRLLWERRALPVARLGLQYLCFALVLGTILDTLGGWFMPLLLFYFAGIAIGTRRFARRVSTVRPREEVLAIRPSMDRDAENTWKA